MSRLRLSIVLLGTLALACASKAPVGQKPPAGVAGGAAASSDIGRPVEHERSGDYAATSHRRFDDVEHWAKIFDDPARPEWQQPEALLRSLGVSEGMVVADLGAGTGFFLPYLSRAVGRSGRVYALEVEPALVTHLEQRARREGLGNVEARLTAIDAPSLPAASVDLLLVVDAYHHIDRRREYMQKAAAVLAPNGRIAVVDWKAGKQPVGPYDEAHKVSEEQVVREMSGVGFHRLATTAALPYQYVLVFALSKASKQPAR